MRHSLTAVVASLTLLTVGSAQVSVLASQPTDVVTIPTSFRIGAGVRSLIQACVGEQIDIQGTSLMVAHQTYQPDGSLHLDTIHFNGQGSEAVGLTTGTVYQVVGADTSDVVFGPGALTASFEANLRVIGAGRANDFIGHILQHITISPAGAFVSEIDVFDITCR